MKGLVLAGGFGTRLRPLTNKIPKPMVKVAGKPVIGYVIDHLRLHNVRQIMVNLHYLPEPIMKYLGTSVSYSYEPELLGEEKTIEGLKDWVGEDKLVVMNADTITNVCIRDMEHLAEEQGKNVRFMKLDRHAGTKILLPEYFQGMRDFVDYNSSAWYWDIGTPEKLEEARKFFENNEKITYMS